MSELARKLIAENIAKHERGEDASFLDLVNCGLRELPEELWELDWLEALHLSNSSNGPGEMNTLEAIPHDIAKLKCLKTFSCGGYKNIKSLKPLAGVASLEILNVSHTSVSDIHGLENLENLQYLVISHTKITAISQLSSLKALQMLDISGNDITDLSPISGVPHLYYLNAIDVKAQSFEPISALKRLGWLEVSHIKPRDFIIFKSLRRLVKLSLFKIASIDGVSLNNPKEEIRDNTFFEYLGYLDQLEELQISWRELDSLNYIKELQKLKKIEITESALTDLRALKNLKNLEEFSIYPSKEGIKDFSPIRYLKKLKALKIHNFLIDSFEINDFSWIAELSELETLIVMYCSKMNPESIGELKKLTILILERSDVSDISFLENMTSLVHLDLSDTKVTNTQPLGKLNDLEVLNLSKTDVSDINSLQKLNKLKHIILDHTKVENLEPLLPFIKVGFHIYTKDEHFYIGEYLSKDSKSIFITGCPLTTPPPEIVQQGNAAILNWFAERAKQQFQNTEIKLILIGNSTVGKTSLSRYLRDRVYAHGQPSTHGIHNYRWAPEGRKLEVNIWDFGGQEYYHATHRLFLSRNSVYALVWDAQTDAGGYGDTDIHYDHDPAPQRVRLEHFPHRWWLHNIRHYTRESNPPVPVLLVQNKSARDGIRRVSSDLEAAPYSLLPECLDNHIDLAALAEDMPEAEGRKWARRFEEFEERLLDKLEAQLAHYEFAVYHRDIRDEVRRRAAAGVNDMSYADFEALCQGFDAEAKMDLVRVYLHDITGDILYYPNHPRLRERVFLRPDWVCNRIYAILSREVLAREGLFDLDWVQQALKCDAEEARDFVELMREFELIFDDSDEEGLPTGQYVAPQYLPDACPKPDKLEAVKDYANLTHAFTLWFPDFLPKSHIARFVAHWGSQAQQRLFWKNGLLFCTAGCTALVERSEGKQIRVDIQAGQPTREAAMQQIFQSFLKLEDGQAGFAVSMDGADFVDWSAVVEAARTHAQEIACRSIADNRSKYLPLSKFQTLLQPVKMTAKKIFLSYAKADRAYLDAARRHLRPLERQGVIALWDDTQLLPGEAWDAAIRRELAAADIILFLVSADLMATDYIWDTEMKEAMARAARGEVAVVPVIIRSCVWDDAPFAQYTALPGKGKPISSWSDPDEAWKEVMMQIQRLIKLERTPKGHL